MTGKNLPKTYNPNETEPRIYEFWLDNGHFAPTTHPHTPTRPFTITLPPPNITGELHVGHALCYLAQDIAGRRARMQGHPTLLLPGMDHAGIATQNVVERQLAAEGLSRHDLGRERFEARCWAFVNATMPTIRQQFQRLGFSFDWGRERFTLDPGYRHAVNRAFVYFFRKGWIYRGYRLVNWCPRCATSISDLEVEHVERHDTLYTIEYEIRDSGFGAIVPEAKRSGAIVPEAKRSGAIVPEAKRSGATVPEAKRSGATVPEAKRSGIRVATTRPETMLGDTAVAVHPEDPRYAQLIGQTAILPLLGRPLPIVADRAVDLNFGTGAVKVTPAHDPLDYEIAQRHGLEIINVIGQDGRMSDAAGPYAGLSPAACRQAVLEALEQQGRLLHQEPYTHNVGTCERCHTVIEPLMSLQWFMKMDALAAPAIEAVRAGRVRVEPERWERVYLHWMENIQDWCISRQLWWGHRIPVWACADCGAYATLAADDQAPTACEGCGGSRLAQESDVLDTWFSSALWPFASLGWPDATEDLRRYYPGDLLGTAGEIIFLWVARMIMEGLEFVGKEPFSRVYINPTVLAEDGRRMSKSLGTGVDPLIACERYGADAIRWALIRDNTLSQTVRFSDDRADEGRRFANKLWNAARFVLTSLTGWEPDGTCQLANLPTHNLPLPDRWILSRLNAAIAACDAAYDGLRFDLAAQALYEFIWGEFCDWYLEIAKRRLDRPTTQATLHHCLDGALRLLHPLMPHITEELWGHLKREARGERREARGEGREARGEAIVPAAERSGRREALIVAPWPGAGVRDEGAEEEMALLIELIRSIRNARAEGHIPAGRRIPATIAAGAYAGLLTDNLDWLAPLAHLDTNRLTIQPARRATQFTNLPIYQSTRPQGVPIYQTTTLTTGPFTWYVPLLDHAAGRERLEAELSQLAERVARAEALLAGAFSRRAPAEVVAREREKLADLRQRQTEIQERLARP